jgi:hypothetical protein
MLLMMSTVAYCTFVVVDTVNSLLLGSLLVLAGFSAAV